MRALLLGLTLQLIQLRPWRNVWLHELGVDLFVESFHAASWETLLLPFQVGQWSLLGPILSRSENSFVHLVALFGPLMKFFFLDFIKFGVRILCVEILDFASIPDFKTLLSTLLERNSHLFLRFTFITLVIFKVLFLYDVKKVVTMIHRVLLVDIIVEPEIRRIFHRTPL